MSWKCSCGVLNASANLSCAALKAFKVPHYQISQSTYDESLYWTRERRVKQIVTENEELHRKFFNEEAAFVVNLTDIELEEHIQELELIVREGKAKLIASSEERKNRSAKNKSKGEWQIAPTGPDVTVTDSINKVKQRGARVSKLDKMRDNLAALGISDKEIDQMLAKMIAQARKDNPAKSPAPTNVGIVTDEQRQAAKDQKAALDLKDKEDAEKEKAKAAAEAQIQPIEVKPAPQPKQSEALKSDGTLDLSKLKFT